MPGIYLATIYSKIPGNNLFEENYLSCPVQLNNGRGGHILLRMFLFRLVRLKLRLVCIQVEIRGRNIGLR